MEGSPVQTRTIEHLLPYISAPLGRLRGYRQVCFAWTDTPLQLAARVALVCHYDEAGRLRRDLIYYLSELREAGFSVVLVSNSAFLHRDALTVARQVCTAVLVRHNVGLDFCAWREALEWLGLPQARTTQILLANDSVYGPLRPLRPLLDSIDEASGLWSMTDSTERGSHLQSYFLLAQSDVIRSDAWQQFWRDVRPLRWKWLVIGLYEVGLTQRLLRAGFQCRALFSGIGQEAGGGANPTLDGWRLLLDAGFPFIKRELLRDNPTQVADLADWRDQVVEIAGPGILASIESDLTKFHT